LQSHSLQGDYPDDIAGDTVTMTRAGQESRGQMYMDMDA